jgi:hypothetical protein
MRRRARRRRGRDLFANRAVGGQSCASPAAPDDRARTEASGSRRHGTRADAAHGCAVRSTPKTAGEAGAAPRFLGELPDEESRAARAASRTTAVTLPPT